MFPQRLKDALMKRSIFDLLCDIWFMPQFSLYIRAFLKPFFADIDPENAEQALNDLPYEDIQIIIKKGIINTFPMLLQTTIDTTQVQINESELVLTFHTPSIIEPNLKEYLKKIKLSQPLKCLGLLQKLMKRTELLLCHHNLAQISQINKTFPLLKILNLYLSLRKTLDSKTLNLYLNPKTVKNKLNGIILIIFTIKLKTLFLEVIKVSLFLNLINRTFRNDFENNKFYLQFSSFEKRSKKILAINNNDLIKGFIISAVALTFQSYISTRTRRLMMQTIMIS